MSPQVQAWLGVITACLVSAGILGCARQVTTGFALDEDAGPSPLNPAPGSFGPPPNEAECAPCSADLKNALDCEGNVIATCTGNQGCAYGKCIDDACQAAVASKSSVGCDYWALKTAVIDQGLGACFAAFVANTWSEPVHITVEYQGSTLNVAGFIQIPRRNGSYTPYDAVRGLAPGEVAILFLSQGPDTMPGGGASIPPCPFTPAVAAEVGMRDTGRASAFHIVTDRPVVSYQMQPFGGGESAVTSATLLLPVSAWDTSYIAINAYPASPLTVSANAFPSLDILAQEDGTNITVLPKAPIVGSPDAPGGPAWLPVTYTLAKGEYVQLTQQEELTGSAIQADKPIAVWGASSCMNIPLDKLACDSGQQQLPPVHAMGTEYAAASYQRHGSAEAPPWRVVGAASGTQLTWEPSTPLGAPTSLEQGEVVEFNAPGPLVVRSQDSRHPFYLGAYMTGGADFAGEGDPEWVNVVPTAQYLDSYVFFTDTSYPETSLVVVRKPSPRDGSFADVTLDCVGTLDGWQPLGSYEYTRVTLVTGDFQGVAGCANGRHEMSSRLPFTATVWGWGSQASTKFSMWVSYAYPIGVGVRSLNDVVVVPK